jgi:predicted TIM-barrel fold metal-dependent hydrolase
MTRTPEEHAAWLAQVVEAPIDPSREIVDPHHHLWDHERGTYLLDDLLADTGSGHRVVQTVFVECGSEWDPDAAPVMVPVSEVGWVARAAASSDTRGGSVIAGIVGHADLRHGRAAGRALDAEIELGGGRFVGIRHATARDDEPLVADHRTNPAPGLMADPTFREGFAELEPRGLTFDAWLHHPQLPELRDLAGAFSATTIVLDHIGGPLGVGRYAGRRDEILATCRAELSELAKLPNVRVKVGGIGMASMGGGWHERDRPPTSEELAEAWGPHLQWVIDAFGADRCMFESNFPVDRESCSYTVLWNTFQRVAADAGASAGELDALFAGTARATYGLPTA